MIDRNNILRMQQYVAQQTVACVYFMALFIRFSFGIVFA